MGNTLLLGGPRLCECPDEIWSSSCEFVVDCPRAGELAFAAFCSSLEASQSNHISGVGMEDLFVGGISRSADLTGIYDGAHVLDVVENDICRLAVDLMVLSASDRCYVRCDAGVDYDILFTVVFVEGETSKDLEATAVMDIVGNLSQGIV